MRVSYKQSEVPTPRFFYSTLCFLFFAFPTQGRTIIKELLKFIIQISLCLDALVIWGSCVSQFLRFGFSFFSLFLRGKAITSPADTNTITMEFKKLIYGIELNELYLSLL